jgi:thioredoxin reductase (NADPH)
MFVKYETIIIGGGPAGLTAGLYTSRFGLKSALFEKSMFGGQIVNARIIENYPGFPEGISGYDLATLMHQQASKFGLEIVSEEVLSMTNDKPFKVKTSENTYETDSIIIAAGSHYTRLGVDGEDKYTGKGVSYCATCDGYMFREKKVAVIGGGDTAISDALELTENASIVYVIHRRDQLRASQILQNRALSAPKLKFVWDTVVSSIAGDQFVKSLGLRNVKTGENSTLEVSGVFVAIGLNPNTHLFANIIELDSNRLIVVDTKMSTSVPGIFAAGDIRRNSPRQVSAAVGDGATAAVSVFKYLKES